jgi:hypothetical protein
MPPEPAPVDLDALDALHARCTPPPWYAHNPDDDSCMNVFAVTTRPREPDVGWDEAQNDHAEIVALTLFQAPRVADHETAKWQENAECIAALHNAYPALRAELGACRAERDRLALALDQARGVLRGVEWAGDRGREGDESRCPDCDRLQDRGHAPACPLARALSGGT